MLHYIEIICYLYILNMLWLIIFYIYVFVKMADCNVLALCATIYLFLSILVRSNLSITRGSANLEILMK